MIEPTESPQNGMHIRAEGEQDRSPEFKAARDHLVGEVNDWLASLAERRDNNVPLPDGTLIGRRPRIVKTILGRVAVNVNAMGTDYYQGVSLEGESGVSPFKLQAVCSIGNKRTDVIEATGSDPLARQAADDGYGSGHAREVVASFGLMTSAAEADEGYFHYDILGDGSVKKRYLSDTGYHTNASLRTEDDIALAVQAFDMVRSELTAEQTA